MTFLNARRPTGASAWAVAALVASPLIASILGGVAQAQSPTAVNGGGSTLLAPVWEQEAKCYDSDTSTSTTGLAEGNSAYFAKGLPVTSNAVTATTVSCSPTTGTIVQYDATGSGTGQAGVLAHDAVIQDVQYIETTMFGALDMKGTQEVYPSIQYGLSDNSLVQTDLVTYDVGTGNSETLSFNGDSGTFTAPSTYQGLTFVGTTHSGTMYPVTKPKYGALVQFPVAVVPIALSYNPTYGSGQTFNVQAASKDTNGGLALDASAYCKIFTGAITNWNDPALTALNNGVSLTGGTSVPIKLIGRSDSSGETSILTRHLAAVCSSYTTTNPYTVGVTTLPSSVQSMFTLVSGSLSMAYHINSTTGALGYIGPDYVLPGNDNAHADAYHLPQAALKNNYGNFEEANGTTALATFSTLLPPQSTKLGVYNSADTSTDRRDPTQWVQTTAKTAALAVPTASGAYPIVGTTNFIGYTCYAASASITSLEGFLNFNSGSTAKTILTNAGLSQLPSAWLRAIANTFLSSAGDAKALNLFLAPAGAGSANPNCQGSTIVGG